METDQTEVAVSTGQNVREEFDRLMDTFDDTLDCCKETMRRKNHDYTSGSTDVLANFRASEVIGVDTGKGILLRILDKIKRITTFLERGKLEVVDESVEDAIDDNINYLILLKHYLRENR